MITIIIPVYNEKKYIKTLLNKVIKLKGVKIQIIIVDDGSSDGSTEILKNEFINNKKINKIIFHKKNLGKGSAIKSAQKYIKGNYTIIQDADLEYEPRDIIKIYKFIKTKKHSVVYGSRVLHKNKYENTKNFTHLIRIWGNVFLTKISNIINNQNLTDAHTCYKMLDSKIFKGIILKEKGFAFCPEVNSRISRLNLQIKEIPIKYIGRNKNEGKKINVLDGFFAIYALVKYGLLKI